ncbi:enhancer of polycomb-like-domain-containing protein [Crucibulum laeve]|uniref:Enhancer of polycomb-like protein n=1 Tax=Crucibulum laeve TaxID=68775 RepID=A0A5C3LZZ1_9AGAR|nr:enhancer of polycomb-like-domain-containing protein [Crucibulum laeve]
MPRNPHPGASTLRNRNRITNKTRLKIHHGNIDADALLIPDEDEEKHRLTNLVAGVDAEDANEHHLQEVLSAAHRNNTNINKSTRGSTDKAPPPPPPTAYIPTPDSTGVVDNHEELYPPNRWVDPATYVHSSTTVEESISNGITNGFTYYMDERDKEWLDKNNEEARGEGTSAQGAVSASGTRMSARSAKAKGKEPESPQPVMITEDEFELVMGVFEKVTHDKTEYLHHSLETGMTFPGFSDYQETFASPLPANIFSTFSVPTWIPPPVQLIRIARVVYPYWKERRVERGGHRIIPALNGDEADTLNESYVCFRRREIKAVRKTRASQVTSSDKLARLQSEMSYPLQLAKELLAREKVKREASQQAQIVWEKRMGLVDLKRKFPDLGDKADEELLIDKERNIKKSEPSSSRLPGLKIRTHESSVPPARTEAAIRPSERIASIRAQVETAIARQKDLDHQWEDQIENVYQAPPVPYTSRLFKFVPPPGIPTWPDSDKSEEDPVPRQPRAVRIRYGRGGRLRVDRREFNQPPIIPKRRRLSALLGSEDDMDVDNDPEEEERKRRLEERWRFDMDDGPVIGPQGADEQDRVLIDDYDSKYLRHTMSLLADPDQQSLMTDPTITVPAGEGRQVTFMPFRLGMPQPLMRRDAAGLMRAAMVPAGMQAGHPVALANGVPVAVAHQIKKMPPPNAVPQMRISSNGGMRPPGVSVVTGMQSNGATGHASPPQPVSLPVTQHSPTNGTNGVSRAAISMPHVEVVKPDVNPISAIQNAVVTIQSVDGSTQDHTSNGTTSHPKSQNHLQMQMPNNAFQLIPMSAHAAQALAATAPPQYQQQQQNQQQQHTSLSLQQMQNLKSAFANMPSQDLASLQSSMGRGLPASYVHVGLNGTPVNMHIPATTNMNLKLPPNRQMQWSTVATPMQRPGSAMNGMDAQGMNGVGVAASPNLGHAVPVRSSSVNGNRPGTMRNTNGLVMGVNGQMSMSPPHQHTSNSIPNISQSQSPPRPPTTSTMASPSLQHQQPVGSSQSGY